jgi:hypothetical protein
MVPTFALPPHFAAEARRLAEAGITSWQQLADLDAPALRQLGRAGGASEARLLRLQGQARLLLALELPPADAALLLHAGIATPAGLAQADPHRLLQQIQRLQRRLMGPNAPLLDLVTLRLWMRRAERRPSPGIGRSTK